MKSYFLIALVAILLPIAAIAQEANKPHTIVVSGTAEMLVQPDEIVFSIDVTKNNKDIQVAKREADETLAKVLMLTRSFNVKPENVRTDYISVEKKYQSVRDPKRRVFDDDGDEIGTRVFLGYDVSTTVIVRLTDISRFEEFYSEVLKTGVSEIDSVKFETSKLRENKDKAREMAMKAAHEKATDMAGAINQTIGKAISITENNTDNRNIEVLPNLTSNLVGGTVTASEPVATFSPGAIRINAQVTVIFLLN